MKKRYVVVISLIGVLSLLLVFKNDKEEVLVKDDINIKSTIAMYKSEDKTNYTEIEEMPSEGYIVNEEKSYCTTDNKTEVKGKVKTIDGNIVITNINKNDKCYVWFDRLDDEKPIISNVTISVTKTEITVTVTATDNIGVTEYWYQIDSQAVVKGTGNTHKFTGLSAGSTHTIKVYVKDSAGNQSDIMVSDVITTPGNVDELIATLKVKDTKPNFSQTATTDEGIFKAEDGMYGGTTYYWRGAVVNNYIKFAGKCWRIVRINGDKSIRLIYDGETCHANGTVTTDSLAESSVRYNVSYNQSSYVGWTYSAGSQRTTGGSASYAKTRTENWYLNNIDNYSNYSARVVDGKFCNDRNVGTAPSHFADADEYVTTWSATGTKFAFSAISRVYSTYSPTLSCNSGDMYTLKIGAITVDEMMLAGGTYNANTFYYLYNGQRYWTMTPHDWSGSYASVCCIDQAGQFGANFVNSNGYAIRPVINLNSNVTFSGGNGTQSNPYVVE